MSSRSKLCVIAASVALLAVAPLSAAPKKVSTKLVPFKGKWTGLVDVTTSTETVTNPDMTTTTTTTTEVAVDGGGNATHLGKFTMDGVATSTSTDPTVGSVETGDVVFTAANGDQVFATIEGDSITNSKGLVDSQFDGTITGGTGRFATSTGYFSFRMISDPDTGRATATFTGKISGPGKGN
ncbi:MAG TPA: hypothetical protein VM510_07200 [Caulifigura sp.]|nr:hypothetical protein [Caulifigura sp.]